MSGIRDASTSELNISVFLSISIVVLLNLHRIYDSCLHIEALPKQQKKFCENRVIANIRRASLRRVWANKAAAHKGRKFEIVFHTYNKKVRNSRPECLFDRKKSGAKRTLLADRRRNDIIIKR